MSKTASRVHLADLVGAVPFSPAAGMELAEVKEDAS